MRASAWSVRRRHLQLHIDHVPRHARAKGLGVTPKSVCHEKVSS